MNSEDNSSILSTVLTFLFVPNSLWPKLTRPKCLSPFINVLHQNFVKGMAQREFITSGGDVLGGGALIHWASCHGLRIV